MNIGDKVRLLRGTEEGVIVRIISDSLVEIEIEDGFSFPVMKNEVVVVHKAESDHFKREAAPGTQKHQTKPPVVRAEKGIYLAFEPKGDLYELLLVNNTDYELAYKLDEFLKGSTIGIRAGHILPKTMAAVTTKSATTFESWADIQFSCMYFQPGVYKNLPLLTRKISFQSSSFISKRGPIPLTACEGYVFQLDDAALKVDPAELRKQMLTPKPDSAEKVAPKGKSLAVAEVDLHLEKLVGKDAAVPSSQALSYQLAVFEKELDKAVAEGLDEVTFIHGVGNGILREEIHKRLSKMKNISYFQDARKERFGYGATLVRIKG